MIRRILVLGSLGLALVAGVRLAFEELGQRAWAARKRELLALAIYQPRERRPWEIRFDALVARVQSSPRFGEITDSSHRPLVAWGAGEPRVLDDLERMWSEALWNELA